ncbi:hypothetical protein OG320_11975 [Microbispora sp. NBC_01189]|uniref:hypothetical protein n=1 Tax=Microbispora sp. NBC_01189 TaxID=2903583 RepID=UPI002E145A6A|nr:hypothetical protein OG320_11975 [Microbispora sp. NBC_01189]
MIRANTETIVARPLIDLLAVTFGPAAVLPPLLEDITGVDAAYVSGSWAARYAGRAGPPPRDVDVLVIGTADLDDLYEAARTAERVLGREVNISRISADSWADHNDPFVAALKDNPLFPLPAERSTR